MVFMPLSPPRVSALVIHITEVYKGQSEGDGVNGTEPYYGGTRTDDPVYVPADARGMYGSKPLYEAIKDEEVDWRVGSC